MERAEIRKIVDTLYQDYLQQETLVAKEYKKLDYSEEGCKRFDRIVRDRDLAHQRYCKALDLLSTFEP